MNKLLFVTLLFINFFVFAQKPCELETNVTDSLGTYKATKQQLIYERNFAGNSTNIYFNLAASNGVLTLDVNKITRSSDFIKADCFNKNSKIFLQLSNGKIITLLKIGNETCGSLIRSDDGKNNRILSSSFVFGKENYEYLKSAKVTFMRIQFAGETVDFPFKTVFVSEMDKKTYQPENYFINYLKCIED